MKLVRAGRSVGHSVLLAIGGFAFAASAHADVTYDEYGVGFVGKGDVQGIYDWNNSMLQDNAQLIRFRMLSSASAVWKCYGVNNGGNGVTSTHSTESDGIDSAVNFDARKNRVGQVTGFVLSGAAAGSTTYDSVGACPQSPSNWQVPRALVEGSIVYEGSGEPLLQISIDDVEWYDLSITE